MASIADMIRTKLDAGTLPLDAPARLWAGIGSGKVCTACEQPIRATQMEYEPEYADGRAVIYFHAECHRLWEEKRRQRESLRKPLSPRRALRNTQRRSA
jgi:hypothetical protein